MSQSILFIHGGGAEAHAEDSKLADSLRANLGTDYTVRNPEMPDGDNPQYGPWASTITQEIAALGDEVILVGHSFGASILLKYLTEDKPDATVRGLFLIATPYWGEADWEVEDYALSDDFPAHLPAGLPIFFYHSRGDEWVPFEHMARYAEKLPQAVTREFEGRGHQFNDDLSEVAADIKSLGAS